jgi:hypothetical protein
LRDSNPMGMISLKRTGSLRHSQALLWKKKKKSHKSGLT